MIAWSYDTLAPADQTILRRLSVFAGAFTLESTERLALAGNDDFSALDVDDAVGASVDTSLVVGQRSRFPLLEPTRQFAQARFASSMELDETRECHLATMMARVGAAHDGTATADEALWVDELDADWPDVRIARRRALDTDNDDDAIFLVIHLASEAFLRRPKAFIWIAETVQRYGDRPGPHRRELLGGGSQVAWTTPDVEQGLALAEEALSIKPSPGTALDCLPQIGAIGALNYSAQPREAADVARIALDLNAASMRLPTRVSLLGSEVMSLALAADPAALSVGREAVMYGERSGYPSLLDFALYSSALAHQLLGGDPVEVALALDRAAHWPSRWETTG